MIFYLILTITLFLILYLASKANSKYQSIYYFVFFTILFLVAGLRGDVGQDTFNYQQHYINLNDFNDFLMILSSKEPFLYIIMYPHKIYFDDYTGFLLLVSLLQITLLSYATKGMYHRATFLAIYILVIFLEYHFNLLRASLSLLFFLCSLRVAETNKKKSILFFCLALFSHLTALIFLPILLLSLKLKVRHFIFIISFFLCTVIVVAIFFSEIILYKISAYGLLDTSSFRLPLVVLALLCFSWFAFLSNKKISFKLIFTLFMFSLAFLMSAFSDVAYRIYFMVFTILLYITFENRVFDIEKVRIQPYVLSVFLLCFWFTYGLGVNVTEEKTERIRTGVGRSDFSFSPYSFYYESEYRKQ